MNRKKKLAGLGALGLGLALGARIAAPAQGLDAQGQRVTNLLREVLSEKVKNASFTITPTADARSGYFSEVVISGAPVRIKHTRLSGLLLHARHVHVSVSQLINERKITTLGAVTNLRATITENDLDQLLAEGKHTADMHLHVKFLPGAKLRVAGNWHWTMLNGPVVGVGHLRLAPGNKVNIDVLSLKLNGAEVPGWVKSKFNEKLNPILDYTDVPFQPRFNGLKVVGSTATLYA